MRNEKQMEEEGFSNPVLGPCSCPMWSGGVPAGICGKDAYSVYIDGPWLSCVSGLQPVVRANRKYYSGYVPNLACPEHGGASRHGPRVFADGYGKDARGNKVEMWCAVWPDFINLQESDAAFDVVAEFAISKLTALSSGR